MLLVAADLEERRLLYAQLLEAGYTVLPLAGLNDAVRLLRIARITPLLILFDTYGDDALAASVEDLLRLSAGSRLIFVVGSTDSPRWDSLRPRVTALLHRPISIGNVMDVVNRMLPVAKQSFS